MDKSLLIRRLSDPKTRRALRQFRIVHLSLIGSYARAEEREESDIDLLYESTDEGVRIPFELMKAKLFLEKMLKKEIDLVSKRALRSDVRPFVEQDIVPLF